MEQLPNSVIIHKNVRLGKGAVLEGPSIIGKPPRGCEAEGLSTVIGDNCHIRPFTTIYAGSVIGDDFETGHGVTIREENRIGDRVRVGTNSVLECGNRIGNDVRIHTGCFLELASVEDNVFIGPHAVFSDDLHPPCPAYRQCVGGPIVKSGAKIGANSTILPGVTVAERALIGAGSVVARDVPPASVAVGNPARVIKMVDELKCPANLYVRPYAWESRSNVPAVEEVD